MRKWIYEKMVTRQDGSTHFILVDKKHSHIINDYNWYVCKDGNTCYAYTNINHNGKRTTMKLHRLIMGLNFGDERVVDHLNHNGLDNRECNLEIKTNQENCMNMQISKRNTSGVTGVNFRKDRQKWQARIHINGKNKKLGHFDTLEEATRVRKDAEKKYYGDNYNIPIDYTMFDLHKISMKSPMGHAGAVGKLIGKSQEAVGLVLRGKELGKKIVEHSHEPHAELKISYR